MLRPALVCGLLATLAGPAAAAPVLFDFESSPVTPDFSGSLTTLTLTNGGLSVTITRPGSPNRFDITDLSGFGAPGFGARSLSPFFNSSGGTAFVATFSAPVTSASVAFGDFGQDADTLLLEAYSGPDATGSLLATATGSLPAGGFAFGSATLTVTDGAFQSIRFIGGSTGFPNSVFYDNLLADTAAVAVPVPPTAALALLGAASVGAGGWVRRRLGLV